MVSEPQAVCSLVVMHMLVHAWNWCMLVHAMRDGALQLAHAALVHAGTCRRTLVYILVLIYADACNTILIWRFRRRVVCVPFSDGRNYEVHMDTGIHRIGNTDNGVALAFVLAVFSLLTGS